MQLVRCIWIAHASRAVRFIKVLGCARVIRQDSTSASYTFNHKYIKPAITETGDFVVKTISRISVTVNP
jgi:hypothetical protein